MDKTLCHDLFQKPTILKLLCNHNALEDMEKFQFIQEVYDIRDEYENSPQFEKVTQFFFFSFFQILYCFHF